MKKDESPSGEKAASSLAVAGSKAAAVIIGLGRIASLLEDDPLREKPCTHAGALSANPDCVLAAGCDTDGERRRLFAEKWNVPVYEDAAEMFRQHQPRIVVVATHPDSHWHYCRLAANCGVPVIICEKPLADTLGEARKIAALAEKGTIIITNHERRYSRDYIRAREILAEGTLGAVLSVRAVLYMGKIRRLLDVLWHDGTHLADAVMFLTGLTLRHSKSFGAPLNSRAGTARLESELTGGKHMQPIPAVMEIGAGRDHLVFEIECSCERGRLKIGNGVFEIWESAPSPYAQQFRSLVRSSETFNGPTGYFANMAADAVHCALDPQKQPVSSAACGLAVIEYLRSVKRWRR